MKSDLTNYEPPDVPSMEWQRESVCANDKRLTTNDFFIENRFVKNSPEQREHVARIKLICRRCPVLEDCRDFAERTGQREGIWAGETVAERRKRWRDKGLRMAS